MFMVGTVGGSPTYSCLHDEIGKHGGLRIRWL